MKNSSYLFSTTAAVVICIIGLIARNGYMGNPYVDKLKSPIYKLHCLFDVSSCGRLLYMVEYDDAIKRNPQDPKAYYERALAGIHQESHYYGVGTYKDALKDLNQAIALDPRMVAAYEERGRVKVRLRDVRGGLADLDRAVDLNPKMPSTYYTRALMKAEIDIPGAIADINKAISLDPKFNPKAYYSLGSLKEKLGDAEGAVAGYEKYISLNPESAYAYKLLAALKADKLKDFQGALADYKKALSLSKNRSIHSDFGPYDRDYISGKYGEPESYENRAKLKAQNLKNPQVLLAYYNELIELSKKSEDVLHEYLYIRRADLKAYRLNDLRGAMADYDRAIEQDPEDLLPNKARIEFKADKLNDRRGALADYTQLIKTYRNESHAYLHLAEFKADILRDYQGALADYNKSISMYAYPKISGYYLPKAYIARGKLRYTKLNDRAGGIADLNKAAQLAKKGGSTEVLNMALKQLKSWGVNK
jgi:tetratricopeptide (TPR) repeat protein